MELDSVHDDNSASSSPSIRQYESSLHAPSSNGPFKQMLLRPGLEWKTFIIFLLSVAVGIGGLVFINAVQHYVIVIILNYPHENLGNATGSLAFADVLLSMPMASVWGFLSDHVGHSIIMSIGLVLMSLSLFLYPRASVVFPHHFGNFPTSLLFFRLIFALGGSATTSMITALIGSLSHEGSRAKVSAFVGVAAALGGLISVSVFVRLPLILPPVLLGWLRCPHPDIVMTFNIMAVTILLTSVINFFLIKLPLSPRNQMALNTRIKMGVSAIKRPTVALAYFSGFVARADSISLSLFIGPWVENYMAKSGAHLPSPDPLLRSKAAKRLVSNLMTASHSATLIGAPFFGILADRLGPLRALIIPSVMGTVSFGILSASSVPSSFLVYAAMFLSGLAEIGVVITSMALISSQSTHHNRGALAGIYSFFGSMGIIMTSKFGGFLFDNVRETAPFLIISLASLVLLIALLIYICRAP